MYFCYILCSLHSKYLNTTYIGFTDDPLHRIRQHNGEIKGGAKYTKRQRPWKLILVISNFPNKIAALKFEWAWQNPFSSNFIKGDIDNRIIIPKMTKKKLSTYYTSVKFKIEVLNLLINSKVFERINLNINIFEDNPVDDIVISDILKSNYTKINKNINIEEFKKNMKDSNKNENIDINDELLSFEGLYIADKCIICEEEFNNTNKENKNKNEINILSESSEGNNEDNKESKTENILKCNKCKCPFHMACLANYELEKNNDIYNLVPKKADCYVCGNSLIWSEWVKDLTDQYKKNKEA